MAGPSFVPSWNNGVRLADTAACEQCGESMPAVASGGARRFCSVHCRNRALAEKQRWHAIRDCPVCHRQMQGSRHTCSKVCGYTFRKLKARRPKACPICKREFWPVKRGGVVAMRYCSRACWKVKASERLAMVQVTCAQCARIFRRTKGAVKRVENVFCNKVCRAKFTTGENHPHWRGGHDANRGPAWRKLAAEIRDRDEHICRRCGRTETENKQKLDVDHIVPWRAFPGRPDVANDPRNLVALCKRCHRIKTSTAERDYLKGDCYEMAKYERAISLPPLLQHYPGTGR